MKKIDYSIVIPVYNEQESLPELVEIIEKTLQDGRGMFEYVFVDDGSTDRSFEVLLRIKKKLKRPCTVVRFRKNLGKSAALAVGFKRAKGEKIITMDADLQDDPREISKLIKKLDDGYDMVVGWRVNRNDKKSKIRMSYLFNFIVSWVGGLSLHDANCGLKAFRRSVAEEIHLYGELHRFMPLLALKKGFRVTEVPVAHHRRKYGMSKFGSVRIVHAAFDLVTAIFITSFKNKPLQIFGKLGLTCIILGILPLIYLSYLHFLGQSIGRRPLLLLGILFVLSGVQLFSTVLLGELIIHIHTEKEQYLIEEIDN